MRRRPDVETTAKSQGRHDLRSASEALGPNEQRLRLALDATGLGTWQVDLPSGDRVWTPEYRSIMGFGPHVEATPDNHAAAVHPDDRVLVERAWRAAQSDLTPYTIVYRVRQDEPDQERWIQDWGRPSLNRETGQISIVGASKDVTESRRADIARSSIEERSRLALHAGRMFAWDWVVGSRLTNRSEHARIVAGIDPGDTNQNCFMDRVHADDRPALASLLNNLRPSEHAVAQFRYDHPDGRALWFETSVMLLEQAGTRGRVVGVTYDITDKKIAERSLLLAASNDALTGLLNRSAIQAQLGRAIRKARRCGTRVALILLDIDHFKDVNDTLGHDAGDVLLKVTATRLAETVGRDDAVARLGGDEFAIVMSACATKEAASSLGGRILDKLATPFRYRGKMLQVKASIGIALFPDHDKGRIKLLKDADLALYAAKNGGRGRVCVYENAMRLAVESRIAFAAEMEATLRADRIVPFYQPKIDLATGTIVGFEALARWIHPERGVLPPAVFAAAFQNPALAAKIDQAIARQVVRDIAGWQRQGLRCGRIAINLSSFSFHSSDVTQAILTDLATEGVSPQSLEIEVTESVFLDEKAEDVSDLLCRFREAGIKISLDDFGTGYASLTHLKQFSVDAIKIDRSFIRDLEADPQDAAIVSAIIGLAIALGLGTVAEGIETVGQAATLRGWGCLHGQGHLYAKPMAASRVPWLLTRRVLTKRKAMPDRRAVGRAAC